MAFSAFFSRIWISRFWLPYFSGNRRSSRHAAACHAPCAAAASINALSCHSPWASALLCNRQNWTYKTASSAHKSVSSLSMRSSSCSPSFNHLRQVRSLTWSARATVSMYMQTGKSFAHSAKSSTLILRGLPSALMYRTGLLSLKAPPLLNRQPKDKLNSR